MSGENESYLAIMIKLEFEIICLDIWTNLLELTTKILVNTLDHIILHDYTDFSYPFFKYSGQYYNSWYTLLPDPDHVPEIL